MKELIFVLQESHENGCDLCTGSTAGGAEEALSCTAVINTIDQTLAHSPRECILGIGLYILTIREAIQLARSEGSGSVSLV